MGFKPLPIGVENFQEIIEQGYYYVDKTAMIKELLEMRLCCIGRILDPRNSEDGKKKEFIVS